MKRMALIWMICWTMIGGSAVPSFSAAKPLAVFVSILPQKFFVDRIGGDRVDVQVMVAPGASPAAYEPKPMQMAALSASAIYFAIGVPFESVWLDKISATSPNMRVVHTEAWIEKIPMAAHHHEDDVYKSSDSRNSDSMDHGRGIRDPHIWLSPPLAMLQARHILTALADAAPADREVFQANFQDLIREITELDISIRNQFAPPGGEREFMVFHPSWGYFAEAYGLRQIPIELEGKTPKPADLQKLIQLAKQRGIQVVFVQPQFSDRNARVIAQAIGGRVIAVDPLAENWSQNLRKVAETFAEVLRP